jgi:hypothetical protein
MPACPFCGHDNAFSELTCAQCRTPLTDLRIDESRITQHYPLLLADGTHSPKPPAAGRSDAGFMALYIDTASTALRVKLANQVILGRYSPGITVRLGVDLEAHGALERGVSRVHAVIRRTTQGLEIEDLASKNGTWLNDEKLTPFLPKPLRSGDRLRLGMLEITTHFQVQVQA